MLKFLGLNRVSKKMFTAIATAVLLVLTDGLGMKLDTETILGVVGVAATYITGQTFVDVKKGS